MANLRAGLIGLGMMGRNHARVLGSLEGVELVAVGDPKGDPHGAAGGRAVLTSVDDLIARRDRLLHGRSPYGACTKRSHCVLRTPAFTL